MYEGSKRAKEFILPAEKMHSSPVFDLFEAGGAMKSGNNKRRRRVRSARKNGNNKRRIIG